MKAVILAGGKGTRLRPYTTILPKPLMPIGDMPILEIMLRQMKNAGIGEAILTVGHLGSLLQAYFQGGEKLDVKISYSYEDAPLGTAGPLSLVRDQLTETFMVSNGDVLTTLDLSDLIRYHESSGAAATIAMHSREVKVDLGVLHFNDSYELTDYTEKPSYNFHVSMGIYVFEPRALNYVPHNAYFDFPDLVLRLIKSEEKVVGYPFEGYWQDLGRHDDYEQALVEFEQMRHLILGETK